MKSPGDLKFYNHSVIFDNHFYDEGGSKAPHSV